MKTVKELMQKYGHIWTVLYFPVYLLWFVELEQKVQSGYTVMHCFIDDYIPFCEYFIVPYLLWFLMIPAVWIYLFLKDKREFYQYIMFLYGGMTICLLICTLFPNGQDMRPIFDPSKNICTKLITILYATDTSTNVFPSIHVFNSIACYIAISKNEMLRNISVIRIGSFLLTVSICLATVFLKQHSILDGFGAAILSFVLYALVYGKTERVTYPVRTQKNGLKTRKVRKASVFWE